jgi:pilus assembly protein FimV
MPTRLRPHWLGPLCASLLVLSPAAWAAGFGKGQLKSPLGQPLDAEFEIFAEPGEQLSERCFQIVKPLDRDAEPEDIVRGKLALERNARQQRIIRLTSSQPVNEPIVHVTLQMSCGSSPFIRKYTFLPEVPTHHELDGESAAAMAVPAAPSAAAALSSPPDLPPRPAGASLPAADAAARPPLSSTAGQAKPPARRAAAWPPFSPSTATGRWCSK